VPRSICGLTYNPIGKHFSLDERDVGVDYFLCAKAI
jgi:hypothetical protein